MKYYKIKCITKCPTHGKAQYLLSIILSVVITVIIHLSYFSMKVEERKASIS